MAVLSEKLARPQVVRVAVRVWYLEEIGRNSTAILLAERCRNIVAGRALLGFIELLRDS